MRTDRQKTRVPSNRWSEGPKEQENPRIHNFHADLNNTESLDNMDTNEHNNDHIMIKLLLHGQKGTVKVNAIIDSGATEDFIDQGLCHKYGIRTTRIGNPRMIYLA